MKLFKISTFVLLSVLSFSSCMKSDKNFSYSGGGVVEVQHNSIAGTTKFLDFNDITIEPTRISVSSVEAQNKFKPSETEMAYVIYSYQEEGNENLFYDKVLKNATLNYAVSVDAKTERVLQSGDKNDSISTAPILRLRSLMNNDKELYLHKGRYLMTGVDYYIQKEQHHLTLVYYPQKQVEGKLIFHLRHSGVKETSSVYTTSYQMFGTYPSFYIKSYNIMPYLINVMHKDEVTIEIHTMVNENSNDLDVAKEKIYSLTYKPNSAN